MDNSWFLDFDGTRILVDPWLIGAEVDYFSWFNKQWHRTKPLAFEKIPEYDFVLITQKYPDHFHPETLKKLKPDKLVVPASIEKKCKKLFPKAQVLTFDQGITSIFGSAINLHFLPTSRKIDPIYDAIVLENGEKSIFLASHGFTLTKKQIGWVQQWPPFALLITPFNLYKLPFFLGGVVSPGMESVKELVRVLNPAKVVATHDEDKHTRGLVSKFASIIRSPETSELHQMDFLQGKYLPLDHYRMIEL